MSATGRRSAATSRRQPASGFYEAPRARDAFSRRSACTHWVRLHPHLEAAGMRAEAAECMRQAKRLLAQVEEGRAAGNKYFGKKKFAA